MSDQMLTERQVHVVYRIEDEAVIFVHYTAKTALEAAKDYEAKFKEPCRVGIGYVEGTETVEERNKNAEL
jgi:hypothetical protein